MRSKRARNNRGNNNNRRPNAKQNFDSNGPNVRVRGNASQVYEKYLNLARDAASAGDRVMAENLFQHAEHYFRIVNLANENMARKQEEAEAQKARESTNAQGNQPEGTAVKAESEDTSSEEKKTPPRRGRRRKVEGDSDGQQAAQTDGVSEKASATTEETATTKETGTTKASDTAADEEKPKVRRPRRKAVKPDAQDVAPAESVAAS